MSAPKLNAAAISAALRRDAGRIAETLLGAPNRSLSDGSTHRWGRRGSLAVQVAGQKRGVWFCHETGQGGDLLTLIQRDRNCDFRAALALAAEILSTGFERDEAPARTVPAAERRAGVDRSALVHRLWAEAIDARGTLVERYLAARRLPLPPGCRDIRFHPACPRGAERLPAIVAAMRDLRSDALVAVHRTFLDQNGNGKAHVQPNKMMLGPARGAVLKLSPDEDVTLGLHIAEGIETGMGLMKFGFAPVWALGSAGAIRGMVG